MEDFVPYKLAKKLKEKGFEQGFNIFGYRLIYSDEETIKFISDIGAYESDYFGENISLPAIKLFGKECFEPMKLGGTMMNIICGIMIMTLFL